jgi:hypothetical protein
MDAADVLAAVIAHPTLWPTVEDLAAATGAGAAEVERAVAELAAAGWVEPWDAGSPDQSIDQSIDQVDLLADAPAGPLRWVLTPLAAERLGLRLDAESARWVPAAAPAEPPRKARRGRTVCETDLNGEPDDPGPLDSFPDPGAPDPAEVVAAAEEADARAPRKRSRADHPPALPQPTILLGERLIWDGPRWTETKPCPGCRGRRLTAARYCLVCERWGLDFLVPSRPAGARTRYERGRLKGGLG